MGDYAEVPLRENEDREADPPESRKEQSPTQEECQDGLDDVLMVVGTLAATVAGACYPIYAHVHADMVTAFVYHGIYRNIGNNTLNYSAPMAYGPDEVANIHDFVMHHYVIVFVVLGVVSIGLGVVQTLFWTIAGERQSRRIRNLYLHSILDQDVAWFDVNNTRMIAANFTSDMGSISRGISRAISPFFCNSCQWLLCFIVAFVESWKLTLACLTTLPLMVGCVVLNTSILMKMTRREKEEYATAGAIAEEALSLIRTVHAFNGQDKERARYNRNLSNAEEVIKKKGVIEGFFLTMLKVINIVTTCIAIGYGTILFLDEGLGPGNVIAVLALLGVGGMGLFRAAGSLKDLTEACEAAFRIFPMIDAARKAAVVATVKTPQTVDGAMEMKGVTFSYPARPDVKVLKDFSLRIEPGQTVALVGHTGSGKSTVTQLLEGFYIPEQGSVFLDGTDTRDLDVRWLRRQIGYVGQEPVLFAGTIAENIRYGKSEASEQDAIDAAMLANAHSFIKQLPKGYNTYVGDSGYQLSWCLFWIAIARALIRKPHILILDEATSALDSAGEALVQQAIDQASEGRTTLIIAHRISTVVGADKIIVLKDGEIVEQGTHKELLELDGYYKTLVKYQLRDPTEDSRYKQTKGDNCVAEAGPVFEPGDKNEDIALEISSPIGRVLAFSRPELHLNVIGWVAQFIYGTMSPIIAVALTEMIKDFQMSRDVVLQSIRNLAIVVICIAVAFALIRQAGLACMAKAAAKLTTRIRDSLFATILNQDMTFFDQRENRVGLLTNRLSTDSITIHGASALKIGFVLECCSSFLAGVFISMYFSWKLSLVVLAFVPLLVLNGLFHGKIGRDKAKITGPVAEMGEVVQQSMNNIRLIRSLGIDERFKETFSLKAKAECRNNIRAMLLLSFVMSLTESTVFFLVTVSSGYGAFLVQYDKVEVYVVFRMYIILIHVFSIIGTTMSYAEDFGKAKSAAARVFHTLSQVPAVNVNEGGKLAKEEFTGEVKLEHVTFHYPARPDVKVLRDMSLTVQAGERVALVGASGCGKTTVTALLERFYDTVSGAVVVDGDNIRDVDLGWYRSQIGVVAQEPVLFDRTIAENIRYGDNSREVTSLEVIEAARTANLHNFVTSLPQGYDTIVGNKGTQVSGGEKQRVAIARALLRRPRLLLLDEATSALDSHNEDIVQDALEKAGLGRTTIIIAHRLSTVQRCDRIFILHEGQIVESGTHGDLMALEGVYYKLIQAQARVKPV